MMNRYRMLIVDDDREVRETLRTALEDEGFTVAVAANGAEAMTKLEERRPRLVLLDLMMPVVDGWEVLDRMRADPSLDDVRVCVCSASPTSASTRADFVLRSRSISTRSSTSSKPLRERRWECAPRPGTAVHTRGWIPQLTPGVDCAQVGSRTALSAGDVGLM